jgi:hypothetical protein
MYLWLVHPQLELAMRLQIVPAPAGSNSYHVVDLSRRNQFGERYCLEPFVTYEQAVSIVKRHTA